MSLSSLVGRKSKLRTRLPGKGGERRGRVVRGGGRGRGERGEVGECILY